MQPIGKIANKVQPVDQFSQKRRPEQLYWVLLPNPKLAGLIFDEPLEYRGLFLVQVVPKGRLNNFRDEQFLP